MRRTYKKADAEQGCKWLVVNRGGKKHGYLLYGDEPCVTQIDISSILDDLEEKTGDKQASDDIRRRFGLL